ncbi:tetratricopeptide repeat protein [Turneriella parva]|uniref:Tetratricopeptide repeat protein n=1 Tax=Turneriella parva (strain ATCC BAA-1111 / DSM 21527 / NCTC 11395 / H) TaxID=869212 RepID=I4B6G0_TURPD|nr:tetratricopeptide repeat protein [Turneriella parva]AFM12867.1 hypothetical protein Turpa_2222 [Turneriella parva DSM 21527]
MQLILRARQSGLGAAAAIAGLGIIFATTLLTTVTRLRMFELRDNLQASNEKDDDLRNASLLSRLALINQRAFSTNRENVTAYKQEAESALIAIRQTRSESMQASLVDRAALPILNIFNFVVGLPRLKLGKTPEDERVLDLAFQFESFREYGKAIRGYDVYLSEFSVSPEQRDFAMLHRGFCHSMIGHNDEALADFQKVAANPMSRNAPIAAKLVVFLAELSRKIKEIEAVQDPARRGELYYEAAAYMKALENFALVDKSRQSERLLFLKARALEETGNTQEAVKIYRNLIQTTAQSPYALNANRRMYLLGTFLGNDESLKQESKKNSETIVKDKEFINVFAKLEKSATQLQTEAKKIEAAEADELTATQKLILPEQAPAPVAVPEPAKPAAQPEIVTQPAPKPAPLNLRSERAAQQAAGLDAVKRAALLRNQEQKIDKLTMADGNIFFGVVFKETDEKVFLYSVLGNLELLKSNISKREKVAANSALK